MAPTAQTAVTRAPAPWLDPNAEPEGGWLATCRIYLRLSDARSENDSFPDREAKLRERAWALRWRVVGPAVIENDVLSGGRRSASAFKRKRITAPDGKVKYRVWRPGFRSILDDLAAGRANALLAEDLDRAVRDPRDLEDLLDTCSARECSADSLSGSLKLTHGGTDAERAMARVMVAMGNKSSADTARRVTAARKRQAEEGRWHGGKRPYGFLADGVTVDPVEAAEILKAANGVLANVSLRQLALDLRRRGVPTVTGSRWTAETLRDILVRPRNAAIMVHRPESKRSRSGASKPEGRYYTTADEVGPAPWEPIIPEDVWRVVVAKLVDPDRAPTTPGPAHKWLGSGIYRCMCGAPMEVIKKGDKISPAYRCKESGSGDGAQHVVRNVAAVDGLVVGTILGLLSQPEAANLLSAPPDDGLDLNAMRTESAHLRQRKADLAAAFAEGDIDRAQLAAGTKRITAKLAKLDDALTAHTSRSPLAPLIGADNIWQVWDGLSLGIQREIVKSLVTVTILPSPAQGRGKFKPESVRISRRKEVEVCAAGPSGAYA
jgi:site-specific DNA recombinase